MAENVVISRDTYDRMMRVIERVEQSSQDLYWIRQQRRKPATTPSSGLGFKLAVITGWDATNYWNVATIYSLKFRRKYEQAPGWLYTDHNNNHLPLEYDAPVRLINVVERASRLAKGTMLLVFKAEWLDVDEEGEDKDPEMYWTARPDQWQ